MRYFEQVPPNVDAEVIPGEVASNSVPDRLGRRQSTRTGNRVCSYQDRRAELWSEGI